MKYDFGRLTERRNTDSLKWDLTGDKLPMWVADMDFETAPEIKAALIKRADHGIFGYTIVPDEWYEAYISHWKNRHGFEMKKEWLMFCTGVVPTLSSTVRKLTTPAENVVVMTPVYNVFYSSILNNGRNVLPCPLIYKNGSYSIDLDGLEEKLSLPQTTLLILCNPHNPGGAVWDRDTLERIGMLCAKNGVTVISDEIHCDITDPEVSYVPFASVSDICRDISVTCISPTKAFNLAGLQTSAISVPNKFIRSRVNRAINTDECAEPNAFAVCAAIAAFNEGSDWLDEMRQYVYENKQTVKSFLEKELPQIKLTDSRATYLLWLDCSEITCNSKELAEFIRKETGLFLSDGAQYGIGGEKFLRMNIACPAARVEQGLELLKNGVEKYMGGIS